MRPLSLMTVGAAALVLTAPAQAKIVEKLVICGAEECTTVRGGSHEYVEGEFVVAPAPLGPYYRVEVTVGDGAGAHDTFTQYYLRSGGTALLAHANEQGTNSFVTLRAGLAKGAHLYGKRTSGLAPLPTPRLTEVLIDGEPAADPASYGVLLSLLDRGEADYPSDADWQTIELQAAGDNPWSSITLEYAPGADTLASEVTYTKLPAHLARRLEARASLEGAESSAGFDWTLVSGSLLAAAALASAAVLLSRRSKPRRTA